MIVSSEMQAKNSFIRRLNSKNVGSKITVEFLESIFAFLVIFSTTLASVFGKISIATFVIMSALLFVIRFKASIGALIRYWPIMLIPAFCIATAFWSEFPLITIRYSLGLTVTAVVGVIIGDRIGFDKLFKYMIISYLVALFLSLTIGNNIVGGFWAGTFRSKNEFANQISFVMMLMMAYFLTARSMNWRSVGAFCVFLLCIPVMYFARASGVMLATSVTLIFGLYLYFTRMLPLGLKLLVLLFILLVGGAIFLAILPYMHTIFDFVLQKLGKDTTLTGRTDLWSVGIEQIKEKPQGVGYMAYWVPGRTMAETFWLRFNILSKTGFHFHNTYITHAVEVGVVGMVMMALMIYTALLKYLGASLKSFKAVYVFTVMFLIYNVIRSYVEVQLFRAYNIETILLFSCFAYFINKNVKTRAL